MELRQVKIVPKISRANKEFIRKLAFVLDEKEDNVLNYLIRLGIESHINYSMALEKRRIKCKKKK